MLPSSAMEAGERPGPDPAPPRPHPCVWGPSADYIAEIRQTRQNRKFLPGVEFPRHHLDADPSTALASATAVVLAVPSRYVRATLALRPRLPSRRRAPSSAPPKASTKPPTSASAKSSPKSGAWPPRRPLRPQHCPRNRPRRTHRRHHRQRRPVVAETFKSFSAAIPSAPTPAMTFPASNSAARSKTSLPSPPAYATASASATTPKPPSSPAASPK